MSNWKVLVTVVGEPQAQLLASFLRGEGIPVHFRSHVPPAVYPFTVDGLAEVQVLVPAEHLERAQGALAAFGMPEGDGEPTSGS